MKENLKLILAVIVLIGFVFIVWYLLKSKNNNENLKNIQDFQQCKDAGYPIQEIYPERCVLPDGRGFSNTKQEPVACTMEAKLCPNGKSVGRIPPNCEFAPCEK